MTRTCLVSEHTRRLRPRPIDNDAHRQLRAEIAEPLLERMFLRFFKAEMRKPYLVSQGIGAAVKRMEVV